MQKWTKEEEKRLRKLFGNNRDGDIAVKLERTVASVQSKATRLALRKTKAFQKRTKGTF